MIDRRWLPLNALRAFDAVARRSSFTGGAQSLSVTQSAISRHVSSLESLLGKRLIVRRPSGIALTEAGERLRPVVATAFDRLETVLNEIQSDTGRVPRVLRLHMPPTFLQRIGLQILQDFRTEFPDVRVDVTSPTGNGLPRHAVDVAVIYDRPQVSDRIMDLLWMERATPVCAPPLARAFAGRPLAELLAAAGLLHVRIEGQDPRHLWTRFARQAGIEIDTAAGITFDTLALAVQYAERGQGVVLCDVDLFAAEIAAGRLAAPSDVEVRDGFGYFLALDPEALDDPHVALFRSWMIARFAGQEPQPLPDLRAGLPHPAAPSAAPPVAHP